MNGEKIKSYSDAIRMYMYMCSNEEKYGAVFHFHILLRLKVSIFLHATEIDVQGNVMFID